MANNRNHLHDCAECRLLGELIHEYRMYDLYYCERDRTTVARYGSEGHEYSTAPRFAHADILPVWHQIARRMADLDSVDPDLASAFVLCNDKHECIAYRPLTADRVEVSYYDARCPSDRTVVVESRSLARYSWSFNRRDGFNRVA